METAIANMEAELSAIVASEVHHYETRNRLAVLWLYGDWEEAASDYVRSFFAMNGEKVEIIETEEQRENGMLYAVNVSFKPFKGAFVDVFTVWLEDVGNGPFVYGEY